MKEQFNLDRQRFQNRTTETLFMTEGALALQTQVAERVLVLVPSTAEQLEALQHPKITPIRPFSEALQEIKTEALMPRSEAPDPIVLERLKKTSLAKWLDYRPDPNKRSYDIGKPMEMLYVNPSDEEAARIRGKSKANQTEVISTEQVMDRAAALNNNFAFLSMYSKRGGKSDVQTATHSQGFAWDKQSAGIENVGVSVLEAVGGTKDVVWVRVGDEKIIGFFRGNRDMQAMAEASVVAPIAAYQENLSHLAKAQTEIQQERMTDVLDPVRGSARKWQEVNEGTRDGFKRAWDDKDDSSLSFWFGSKQIEQDGKLIQQGIGLNEKPITWEEIALKAPELALGDTTTTDIMLSLDRYFSGEDVEDRYAIMFTWSPDTTCCADAVSSRNSQSESGLTNESVQIKSESSVIRRTTMPFTTNTFHSVRSTGGGRYNNENCSSCGKDRNGEDRCKCSAEKSNAL